ncbi:hypothetical protein [Gracilibacillus alcaliphilus]|uniref:hypothetical protein n=1 Tax=Gracilibacillus alcaliphilus TaxID=1401441 RepID=UPI0019599B66|nr:hypothetical protein [Gracilibacillus alcaliphilus]MBM7675675.1 hypothetical protein [Gracilibacillus alcaliphilus]
MSLLKHENIKIKWLEHGKWTLYDLTRQADWNGLYVDTADHTKIKVEIQQEESQEAEVLEKIKVKVETDRISGIQLVMPIPEAYTCTWKTHLAPEPDMVIGDRVFRSPTIVAENAERMCTLVPDLHDIKENRVIPHVMDYVQQGHYFMYGLSNYEATGHVYYRIRPRENKVGNEITFQFYLVQWKKRKTGSKRDYRPLEKYLWEKFACNESLVKEVGENPSVSLQALEPYVRHTYNWSFHHWASVCWQEFDQKGSRVGSHVFIVTANQKPGKGSEEVWREKKSIWNQAWFSSIRSTYGYALWGRHWKDESLIEKAEKSLQFTLSAPQMNGLFPGCYEAGADKKWENGSWRMSSDRQPDPSLQDYVHLLDASWTCYWLLKWYRDIERKEIILQYVKKYVERLLLLQYSDGNFPAWVRPTDLDVSEYLKESPETSVHVMLLCLLYEIDPDPDYIEAAEKAGKYVLQHIVSQGRWEDFETYWSCSREWSGKQYRKKDARSGLYNQCNFGIYWTAEALKDLFKATNKGDYLEYGEQVLAEMSLFQQIWQPPFYTVPTIGGFGVMTSDDEWNDARQSLFSLTYLDYYQITGKDRYKYRGLLAMKASFYMMYCPENKEVKKLYEATHPHFNQMDYGFHMENFNHADSGSKNQVGEFTIFDWGNGAAAASLAEITLKRNYFDS